MSRSILSRGPLVKEQNVSSPEGVIFSGVVKVGGRWSAADGCLLLHWMIRYRWSRGMGQTLDQSETRRLQLSLIWRVVVTGHQLLEDGLKPSYFSNTTEDDSHRRNWMSGSFNNGPQLSSQDTVLLTTDSAPVNLKIILNIWFLKIIKKGVF